MSDNPFRECAVGGLSVLCAFLHCRHICAYISLQLCLIVFHCSVALMRSSGGTLDDCSFSAFGFHTFCSLYVSDGSGSHCKMMPEGPGQFNFSTLHIAANVSVAPFVSTTVDVLHPQSSTHMLNMFSPSEAATSFNTKVVTLYNGKFAVFL